MPLHLVHGPPNSGRAGLIRQALSAVLERDPVLVVPTLDDVYAFERELCAERAVLGAAVMTFRGLYAGVATTAGRPPGPELTRAQRLGAVSATVAELRRSLGPLATSAARLGFDRALERLLGELQEAGLGPEDVEGRAATLEGSAYLGDVAALFSGYARVCDRLGRSDAHAVARAAIAALREDGNFWSRPVFLYGFDDLTRVQRDLIAGLAEAVEVTVALPYEEGNTALAARGSLLASLRELGAEGEVETTADAGNTPDSPLLFAIERGFGGIDGGRHEPDDSLVLLRSAGERAEAESIAAEVARLLAAGADPGEIAVVVRDPGRRGPLLASVLSSYGVAVALEAEVSVARTSVGGSLLALLEAVHGSAQSADLLRYMRGPSGIPARMVDGFERRVRRDRAKSAPVALKLWEDRWGELPGDVAKVRDGARDPVTLTRTVAGIAATMASRCEDELESRAGAAIANALAERAELDGLAPAARSLARTIAEIDVRAWSGPVDGRVRIADPYRLRAARFDCVFVASLQDGEFPRRDGRGDPFLSEGQRESLGLQPRRDVEAEERYLFHASLALPRQRLFLSFRDSDESGAAEAPSPFLAEVLQLLDGEPELRGRDLATVVHRIGDAPSEHALARAIAARGRDADAKALLDLAGAAPRTAERIEAQLAEASRAESASRAPGPLSDPAVLEELAAVGAYGGTTLEGFDVCSYRWFVSHELAPQLLDPAPDPLVQGGLMHAVLERLYRERPGGDPLPRPGSLGAWIARGHELLADLAAERAAGSSPPERAIRRRVEVLLERFLADEARRETNGFEPWLLEAAFGEAEGSERPTLEIDGWGLHGAIDRVDRAPDGRALVIDYKLSGAVTAREKLEEEAKLQLQLYLLAVEELWDAEAVGGIYHPLRGTSSRRPRGVLLSEAAEDLGPYRLARTDLVEREDFEVLLADARLRAGQIVARMRTGDIRRDPGPRTGLRGHGVCPPFCDFAPICRRDRAPVEPSPDDEDER